MKKATMIFIAILYVASIVVISVFGMKTYIYNEIIPVTKVECLNETDSKTIVTEQNGRKIIRTKFEEPGNAETLTGTMIQLVWRVTPDNATQKGVEFIYNKDLPGVTFVKDEKENELGLILFDAPTMLDIRIMSTDGSRVYTDIIVWAYI